MLSMTKNSRALCTTLFVSVFCLQVMACGGVEFSNPSRGDKEPGATNTQNNEEVTVEMDLQDSLGLASLEGLKDLEINLQSETTDLGYLRKFATIEKPVKFRVLPGNYGLTVQFIDTKITDLADQKRKFTGKLKVAPKSNRAEFSKIEEVLVAKAAPKPLESVKYALRIPAEALNTPGDCNESGSGSTSGGNDTISETCLFQKVVKYYEGKACKPDFSLSAGRSVQRFAAQDSLIFLDDTVRQTASGTSMNPFGTVASSSGSEVSTSATLYDGNGLQVGKLDCIFPSGTSTEQLLQKYMPGKRSVVASFQDGTVIPLEQALGSEEMSKEVSKSLFPAKLESP